MLSDFKYALNAFLQTNALIICLVIVGATVIILAIFLILYFHSKKHQNNAKVKDFDCNSYLEALGNKDNITDISKSGSRITVKVKDIKIIDKEKLHNLGIDNILTMSEKVVLVKYKDTETIYQLLLSCLSKPQE